MVEKHHHNQARARRARWGGATPCENTMYRLLTAGCVLALGLLSPRLAAGQEAVDNPAARKLNVARVAHRLPAGRAPEGAGPLFAVEGTRAGPLRAVLSQDAELLGRELPLPFFVWF